MQAIQLESESIDVPECLSDPKRNLVMLKTRSTEDLINFLKKKDTVPAAYQLEVRYKQVSTFKQSVGWAQREKQVV